MNEEKEEGGIDALYRALKRTGQEVRRHSTDESFDQYQEQVKEVLQKITKVFQRERMLLNLHGDFHIIGDLHGQYYDLFKVLELAGEPSDTNKFLFLGDYVDRGKFGLETILYLFCLKLQYPNSVYLLRGNHESATINRIYGFYDECRRRFTTGGVKMWKTFTEAFNYMPVAARVNLRILCMHGGISPELEHLQQIAEIPRPSDIPDCGLLCDLTWSDPRSMPNCWEKSSRGCSFNFNEEALLAFLTTHDLDLIVRAHEIKEDGYEFFANQRLITVFSAPYYCGEFDNAAAFLTVKSDLECSIRVFSSPGDKPGHRKVSEQYKDEKMPARPKKKNG
eukprot:gene25496-30781_t